MQFCIAVSGWSGLMLSFEEVFSLDKLQTQLLSEDKNVDPDNASLRCIGYHAGLVLFVYYTTRDSSMVTRIGCYCMKEMELRILYTHGDKIDVLTGSLNEEKTLLGKYVSFHNSSILI